MSRIGRGIGSAALAASLLTTGGWNPLVGHVAGDETEIPATNPLAGDEKAIAEGRGWYRAVCSPCHGGRADGGGERGQGADLRVFSGGFKKFVDTVKNGRDTGRAMKMPPWGAVLTTEQIFQIGAYLETLAKEGANWKTPTN
jgi:mono/diheme cytochrome c family protein